MLKLSAINEFDILKLKTSGGRFDRPKFLKKKSAPLFEMAHL